ncbi:MAG: DUF3332 family protein [Myxococcota bacterium]
MLRILNRALLVVCLTFTAATSAGCLGQYALFNKVQDWNATIGDKWVNSVVHFAFWIVPVYPITLLGDLLIINTVEFWSGSNPVGASAKVTIERGENEVVVSIRADDGSLYAIHSRRGEPASVYRDGSLVGSGEAADDGSWLFHDLEGQQTRVASPEELAAAFPKAR